MGDRHQFRAKWHDYAYGVYFVTVCCAYKQHYFGEILNERMEFSSAGIIATSQIQNIPKHFENVELLNFVVMPNHIHLVIAINKPIKNNQSAVGTLFKASTSSMAATQRFGCLKPRRHDAPAYQDFHHNNSLAIVIRGLKGGIKRDCGKQGIVFQWQSRYHEHIIRNRRAFDRIMNYIVTNVENWCYDRFHPSPLPSAPWDNSTSSE